MLCQLLWLCRECKQHSFVTPYSTCTLYSLRVDPVYVLVQGFISDSLRKNGIRTTRTCSAGMAYKQDGSFNWCINMTITQVYVVWSTLLSFLSDCQHHWKASPRQHTSIQPKHNFVFPPVFVMPKAISITQHNKAWILLEYCTWFLDSSETQHAQLLGDCPDQQDHLSPASIAKVANLQPAQKYLLSSFKCWLIIRELKMVLIHVISMYGYCDYHKVH